MGDRAVQGCSYMKECTRACVVGGVVLCVCMCVCYVHMCGCVGVGVGGWVVSACFVRG